MPGPLPLLTWAGYPEREQVPLVALIGEGEVTLEKLSAWDVVHAVNLAITTAVVLVVAAENPQTAWQQPLLRLADTVAGVTVGIACKWIASFLFFRFSGQQAR